MKVSIMERADTGANVRAKITIYLIENKLLEVGKKNEQKEET